MAGEPTWTWIVSPRRSGAKRPTPGDGFQDRLSPTVDVLEFCFKDGGLGPVDRNLPVLDENLGLGRRFLNDFLGILIALGRYLSI